MGTWSKIKSSISGGLVGAATGFITGGPAGAAIGAGIGAYGSYTQSSEYDKNLKAQQDMIDKQNEYNSPANQMLRLQEAGLNPYLVYSSGNVTGNQSGTGTAPTYTDKRFDRSLQALNSYLAVQNHDKDMQIKDQDILTNSINNKYLNSKNAIEVAHMLQSLKNDDLVYKAEQIKNEVMEHNWKYLKDKPHPVSLTDIGFNLGYSGLDTAGKVSYNIGNYLGNLFK
ncbi:DNA pilot protein [Peromfec virus RodF8_60]|uniref:DNA pilot protein n=1 Tax=Peromfec virus RodF8_60 TaxID=2929386 RepID=A0A976N296_9VIRU|nr:DNA pilot protein [Peromfec virus RodF8_60]